MQTGLRCFLRGYVKSTLISRFSTVLVASNIKIEKKEGERASKRKRKNLECHAIPAARTARSDDFSCCVRRFVNGAELDCVIVKLLMEDKREKERECVCACVRERETRR